MMSVIAGVPDTVVEYFQIVTVLSVSLPRFGGVCVDQCATIKRREQPFVGVNDKTVRPFDTIE